jgi:hypothetical protein
MDTILMIILIIVTVCVVVTAFFIAKKKRLIHTSGAAEETVSAQSLSTAGSDKLIGVVEIPISFLPATTEFENKKLCEIKDTTVISRISALLPTAAQMATQAVAINAQNTLNALELVKIDIPFAQLTKSKDIAGAARGYIHGAKGVAKQANLTKVDLSKITQTTAIANGVANVMNIGSLVVGQYYMSEINSKLDTMTKSIDKISDFQDREFKSRILSVIARVSEITEFSTEIIENDEHRRLKLSTLEDLKGTATELLGQVNITIGDITGEAQNLKYDDYLSQVNDLAILVGYQNALVIVLEEISKLTYLLGKGGVSTEISYSTYKKYLSQTTDTRKNLAKWHEHQVQALQVDLGKKRVAKSGIEAVVAALPALIDPNFKFKDLKEGFAQKINSQTQFLDARSAEPKAVYDEDVEIVAKDGKYYYLLENQLVAENNT